MKLIQVILYWVLCPTFSSVKDYVHDAIFPIQTTDLGLSLLHKLVSSSTFISLDTWGAVEK